jgi:hypothetical protein
MSADLRKALQASWRHSHEEDEGGRLVFRRGDAELPPSRGRQEFTLKSDGEAAVSGPGPDDRRRGASGRWTLKGKVLRIDAPNYSATFEVQSVDGERLIVRRVEEG